MATPSFPERIGAAWRALRGESTQPGRRLASVGIWDGAKVDRLTRDSVAQTFSPTTEVRFDARFLRARARALARDTAFAAGYLTEFQNQVVGPSGFRMQAKIRSRNGDLATATNDEIERGFKRWSRPQFASVDRRHSWLDIQRITARTMPMDGEVYIRRQKFFDNDFGFALQFIDADLLDEQYNQAPRDGVNEIRMGVEIDKWGAPINYWFWTRHPDDIYSRVKLDRVPVPASEISALGLSYRANQLRAVTWFAPVMFDLGMMKGYRQAHLVATRMGAAKMGFLVQTNPDILGATSSTKKKNGEDTGVTEMEASPGVIEELPPGYEFQQFDPSYPHASYKEFEKAINLSASRGLGMAYTTATGDLEAVNYSSIRAGMLSERDFYRGIQQYLITHLCEDIYRDWLEMAVLTGQIKVDARLASDYDEIEWQGRGWKWVDPMNDLQASVLAIQLGLDTRHRLAAEVGLDFEENIDQLKAEQAYAAKAGVALGSDPAIQETKTTVEDPNARDMNQTQQTTPAPSKQPPAAARNLALRRHA
jgi:lambda family phage portal protein